MAAVTILPENFNNDDVESGAYVLRIGVAAPLSLSFGRYQDGRPIDVPDGEALYVGSAMGNQGSSTLARRLLRHATRTGLQPPHRIRDALLARLRESGMVGANLNPPTTKTCRWHIDYLLDQPEAELTHILAIRSTDRMEAALAERLTHDPHTTVFAPGLGASDSPGATHLFSLNGPPDWWRDLFCNFFTLSTY